MHRLLLAPVFAVLALVISAGPAGAETLLPPAGHAFSGLSGSTSAEPYASQAGRPAVFGTFTLWGARSERPFTNAAAAGARPMLHISTTDGYFAREVITPLGIARGAGDDYLLWLNARMAQYGGPVYVRLLAEMNQANNAYGAYDRSGRYRGAAHSTRAFKQAWRRAALILRGGDVAAIDARLAALKLPAVRTSAAALPQPHVAMLWVPQTAGSPDIPANSARAYWPGGAYVDWVGTDFYSKFPGWAGLERFYREFRGKPFVFGEWALWGADDPGFTRRLFGWMRSHRRVRMALYNQGAQPNGPFRLNRYPRSRAVIRAELRRAYWIGG